MLTAPGPAADKYRSCVVDLGLNSTTFKTVWTLRGETLLRTLVLTLLLVSQLEVCAAECPLLLFPALFGHVDATYLVHASVGLFLLEQHHLMFKTINLFKVFTE